MSSSYHGNISFTIFGQSHSPAIGVVIEGLPAGFVPDMEELNRFLARRAPGHNACTSARREADRPEFLSGLYQGKLCGVPLTAIIENQDARPEDYEMLRTTPRPGHADYTAEIKYGGAQDPCGGGHFSGRLTAPLCVVGGLCKQLLAKEGVEIISRISEIAGIEDKGELIFSTANASFPVVDHASGEAMQRKIMEAKESGDSVGGIVECALLGVPAGLGDPMFDGMENRISRLVFAIPGVKGISFGAGFAVSKMKGSENNDCFTVVNGKILTKTNHCGGILGGITNGMPIVFHTVIKPTPSIAMEQDTVDLSAMKDTKLMVGGRHDPCIVPRAVPCIEAAAAIAVYDALLERRKNHGFE